MVGFTFEVIKRGNYKLYNLFSNTIIDRNVITESIVVEEREEARMDLISLKLYGSTEYIEELMMINNILNPFSIEVGATIKYVPTHVLEYYQDTSEPIIKTDKKKKTNNKSTRKDLKRPPTLRPDNFEQVLIDKENKTLKLNTKVS